MVILKKLPVSPSSRPRHLIAYAGNGKMVRRKVGKKKSAALLQNSGGNWILGCYYFLVNGI